MKESALIAGKRSDNGNCGSPRCRKQLLIRLEKALVVLQIGEIVVVEGVRGGGIEVGQSGPAPILRAYLL